MCNCKRSRFITYTYYGRYLHYHVSTRLHHLFIMKPIKMYDSVLCLPCLYHLYSPDGLYTTATSICIPLSTVNISLILVLIMMLFNVSLSSSWCLLWSLPLSKCIHTARTFAQIYSRTSYPILRRVSLYVHLCRYCYWQN